MQLRLAITNNFLVELNYGRQKFARLFAPHLIYRRAGGDVMVAGLEMLVSPVRRQLELGQIRSVLLTSTCFGKDPELDLASAEYCDRIFPR